jgi:hypothetical protein
MAAESAAAEGRLVVKVPAACTAAPHADTDKTDQDTADKFATEVCIASVERVHGRADETPS